MPEGCDDEREEGQSNVENLSDHVVDPDGDLPKVEGMSAELALGLLNQSVLCLIEIHDELPYELDTHLGTPLASIGIPGPRPHGADDDSAVGSPHSPHLGTSPGSSHLYPIDEHKTSDSSGAGATAVVGGGGGGGTGLAGAPVGGGSSVGWDDVSPLAMSGRTVGSPVSTDTPNSPDLTNSMGWVQAPSSMSRRRRRSSVLAGEATAVATIVSDGLQDLTALHGRHRFSKRGFVQAGLSLSPDPSNSKATISKRFWSKTPPEISITKYLIRMHKYCPNSAAVYLSAAVYIYRLCVVLHALPLTTLCVHRVVLAAVRIASKALEDVNYVQKRFAMVGGIAAHDLYRLEIAFLYLVDFDLKVDAVVLEQCIEYVGKLAAKARR